MKILFIRFSSLGDVALVTGVLRYFAYKSPDAHSIEFLTFREYTDIFDGADYIQKLWSVPRGISLADYTTFLRTLPRFDIIVDLHCNLRSRLARLLLKGKRLCYNKNPIARRSFVQFRLCRDRLTLHTVQRYALAFFPFFSLELPSVEELRPFIHPPSITVELNQVQSGKRVVIHPFASRAAKEWPYFPELVEFLKANNFSVHIIGIPHNITPLHPIPTPTIRELINVINGADLFITTDSGPMHIAVALGVNVAAIFGSTSKELGFYPIFSKCAVIEEDIPCRPCHIHGAKVCKRGDFACMRGLTLEKVKKFLALA
ncbi:MAG: glycosyltransferase family 9 protein [Deferribacteraceae bacterium]|jgi:ADP-heptose:LPS heptosyltransferase|nr:glycosyltransferase family 9 protein [Deferribacteraceae bacterium]